ncbi:hypothetical protein N7520_004926 [Penicillium odoratum]|uniref:uncharacterized protein n=1 Tax=Penicillium odoratum TaxID=1167516 RepID=UPI002548CC47|nr:uncharacterized protein N7520_004926 [Penicillium odoratum]KAJ5765367.1 hypothetical protein N7520_004926 [Penicillium odoratum]
MDTLPDAFAPAPSVGYGTNSAVIGTDGEVTASQIKVTEAPKFDLESYIDNYAGRTRFNRLYLIGTTSTVLAVEALKQAEAEALCGKDVDLYEKAVRALAEVAPNDESASLNSAWVQEVQRNVMAQTDRLEHELRGYKNNLIKESIRMGNEDLGNHYYETGDLIAASKAYTRMRDFCTTPNHVASMLYKLINVSIERGDWLSVKSYVHRLRNAVSKPEDLAQNQPKMSVALGLAHLNQGSYNEAANCFLAVPATLGESYKDVISPNDVAVYGGLCALASMDRSELQHLVLDNISFRPFLELEPHIRRAIGFFCNSKFRSCFDILETYRNDYLLDIYLQPHVSALYTKIRVKSMQQYLVPFSKATLDSMVAIFAPNESGQQIGLESPFVQELIRLIMDGVLDVRIDLEHKLLVKNQHDIRSEMQTEVLENVTKFTQELHWRMMAAAVTDAGLQVPGPATSEKGWKAESKDPRFGPPGSG